MPHFHPLAGGDVALALQVGGASRRMGSDKAYAPFGDSTLLEWVRDRVTPGFGRAFLVAKEPTRFSGLGLPVVADVLAESGSAVGIYTALLASPTEYVLSLGCDMPFVTPRLLRCLATGAVRGGYEVFVPRHGGHMEPLAAVYRRSAAPAFKGLLASGERRIDRVFPQLRTGYLDLDDGRFGVPELLFTNVNTPEDLASARRRLIDDPGGLAGLDPELAGYAPRVRAFIERIPLPVVSFVGKKKSGKTSVLLGVIPELVRRGYRVGVVKHDTHGFEVDVPGTDSYRLREAGAVVAGITSPERYVWISSVDQERSLDALVSGITEPLDLLITEGFKRADAPKIEVSRRERSGTLIADEDELVGIVSDQEFPDYRVPRFELDDPVGIADLVERRILGLCAPQPAGPA